MANIKALIRSNHIRSEKKSIKIISIHLEILILSGSEKENINLYA